MKLLFDQNISFRVLPLIKDIFPEADQIHQLGFKDKTDREIWDYAKENNYVIVTFDGDFYDFSLVWGHPPKIIWLRVANHVTKEVASVLRIHQETISLFGLDEELACLEIIKNVP
jgi:predicted nuclease of predicted toxin-antitoxin system